MNWLLPESVSTFGGDIDRLYYIILWITGIVFVVTEVALVYFIVRYRHKEGRRAEYIHGNTKAEIVWTAVPFVIVLALALMSRGVWADVRDPGRIPPGAMKIWVTAKQFEWNVTYAGADGELGTEDDFVKRNIFHVPVDRPVHVVLRAEDVIHSFFLPDLRVKQDAVPGMDIPVWFEATKTGEYVLACAELCGNSHYRMKGSMVVLSQEEFAAWERNEIAPGEEDAPEEDGSAEEDAPEEDG